MKHHYILYFLLMCALALLGQSCIRMELLIHVYKNGSGTMDLTYLMSPQFNTFFDSKDETAKKQAVTADGDASSDLNMFNKAYFEKESRLFAPDMELFSYEEIKEEHNIGGKAQYKFRNINLLKTSLTPAISKEMKDENLGNDNMKFSLEKKGKKRFLTITLDEQNSFASNLPEPGAEKNLAEEEDEEEFDLGMLKSLLKDMYISLKVSVDGKITYCNSDYVEENVVTILEADFNKLFENKENLKQAGMGRQADGFKFTNVKKIVIEFE